jgi:hypothetical protein
MLIAVVVWLGSTAESRMAQRLAQAQPARSSNGSDHPTEVLAVPFGESDSIRQPDGPAARAGASRSSAQVDGVLIELVQTPDGPRMRYTRLR